MNQALEKDEAYMRRALQLAALGRQNAHPNPMVGAVLVREGRIIGEGYHANYGGPHAEVNAINSVKNSDLLKESTLYVTLEPCAHYGKTPPCAELIVECDIPEVVIGIKDPFSKVNGQGIEILKKAGIRVKTGVLGRECYELNKHFFYAHENKKPYITLKWAESSDGFLAQLKDGLPSAYSFSTPVTQTLVHKLRSEYDGVMIGSRTSIIDSPQLNVRSYTGRNPIKVILDKRGEIPPDNTVFHEGKIIYFSDEMRHDLPQNVNIIAGKDFHDLDRVLHRLYEDGITSLLVEGGPTLLRRMLEKNLYNDIRREISPVKLGENGYGSVFGV